DEPSRMVRWLKQTMSPRKFRLLVCACCRSLWDELTTQQARDAVDVLERYADRQAGQIELDRARAAAEEEVARLWEVIDGMSGGWVQSLFTQAAMLRAAVGSAFREPVDPGHWAGTWTCKGEHQSHLLRDIFGNP